MSETYYESVWRRKRATARVRLYTGDRLEGSSSEMSIPLVGSKLDAGTDVDPELVVFAPKPETRIDGSTSDTPCVTDILWGDPQLSGLGDYGGPTPTAA